jgi:hypothetical protein
MSYFPAPIPQPVTATAGDFAVTAVGIVGVTQATSPWVTTSTISGISTVTGTVFATLAGTSVVAGVVSATQGTSPWIVAGTVSATQGTSPWVVSAAAIGATQSGVWAVNSTVTSIPGVGPTGTTAPTTAIVNGIIVSGTLQAVSSTFPMPVSGALSATQGTSPWVVSGAVSATQGTSPWVISGAVSSTQGTVPWSVNATQFAGITLGATAVTNYGSSPAAVIVPGVNAFVTNTVNVQDSSDGPVSAGSAASKSMLIGGVAATSAPSPTAGQQIALQLDSAGNLRINPFGNTGSFVTVTATGNGSSTTMFTVPSGKKWVFKSCQIQYTSANSGSVRTVGIYVAGYDTAASATYAVAGMGAGVTQALNTVGYYTIAPSLPLGTSFVNTQTTIPFPEVVLGPGSIIVLEVVNAVSTDAWQCGLNVIQLND